MATYNKEEFQEYLSTKVADSTAKIYVTDMAVCVKALEKIKLYDGKELVEILEDFVSHKKAVKNYLQDEFLNALTEIGSNDSGLYDSLLSKAKHYLVMDKTEKPLENEKSNATETFQIKLETYIENDNGTDYNETADNWISFDVESSLIDMYINDELDMYDLCKKALPDSDGLSYIYYDYFGKIKNSHYLYAAVLFIKFRDLELELTDDDYGQDFYYDYRACYEDVQSDHYNKPSDLVNYTILK